MVIGEEMKKRFLIEVVFRDLILILKGKKRCFLKFFIGKIMFGRIVVVMGLLGVGKMIFLFVLVGKVTGCIKIG